MVELIFLIVAMVVNLNINIESEYKMCKENNLKSKYCKDKIVFFEESVKLNKYER